MSAVAYTSNPKPVRGHKSKFASDGREIAWLGGKMFAEITVDGFGRGGWVHFFRPRRGIANPLWARSRTHAHQIIEMQAEARA